MSYPQLIKPLLFIACITLISSCGETTPAAPNETASAANQPTTPTDTPDSTTNDDNSTDTNPPPDDSNTGGDNSNPGDSNNGGDNSNTGDSNNGGDNSNPDDSNNGGDNSNPDHNGVPVYTCPEDDIYEDNDNVDTATAISPTLIYHAIACSLDGEFNHDGDLFSLRVDEGCSLEITVEFTHSNGDLDIALYTRSSNFLGVGGNSDTDNETITHTATSSDEYFISIIPYQTMGNQYALQVYLTCP